MKTGLSCLFALIILVGCADPHTRDFSVLGPVTTINVTGSDASNLSPTITNSRTISQVVDFVDSHRTGWHTPWYGVPVPSVVIEFYNGTEFKGSFGVGKNFLETQRNGGFFSQSAAPDEVRGFLGLLAPKSDSQVARVESGRTLDDDFKILTSVEQLPTQVKSAFAALVHQPGFEMADPGRDFQVTDVITRKGLPRRRLIFAGISDKECFLHYEMGGRGHSYYVVVFSREPSDATLMWGEALPKPTANLAELRLSVYATNGPATSDLTF